jgi:hypothetical protein
MPSSSQFLSVAGSLLLLHAAYSCLIYRELVQELQLESGGAQEVTVPPLDVYVEVALGFVSLLLSEFIREASLLRPIQSYQSSSSKNNTPLMAAVYMTREFDIYATRARGLQS